MKVAVQLFVGADTEENMEPGRYVAREGMAQWWVQDTEDEMRIICMCPREHDAKMIADALNGPNKQET